MFHIPIGLSAAVNTLSYGALEDPKLTSSS